VASIVTIVGAGSGGNPAEDTIRPTTAPRRVLGQSIRAGRRVRRGTIVRLLISRRVPVRPP
jgi:hypothetical protein